MHCPWQDSAANDHSVAGRFLLDGLADLLTDAPDIKKVQIAVGLARGFHANKTQLGRVDGFRGIAGRAHAPRLHISSDELSNLSFNNRGLAFIDEVDFGWHRVNTNYLMPFTGKAPGRNRPYITQSENADFQVAFLSSGR